LNAAGVDGSAQVKVRKSSLTGDLMMFGNLLENLNSLLLSHPNLLAVMRFLFWFKSWLLLSVFGIFVLLVYREGRLTNKKAPIPAAQEDTFLA
jgi:hypothetical protein